MNPEQDPHIVNLRPLIESGLDDILPQLIEIFLETVPANYRAGAEGAGGFSGRRTFQGCPQSTWKLQQFRSGTIARALRTAGRCWAHGILAGGSRTIRIRREGICPCACGTAIPPRADCRNQRFTVKDDRFLAAAACHDGNRDSIFPGIVPRGRQSRCRTVKIKAAGQLRVIARGTGESAGSPKKWPCARSTPISRSAIVIDSFSTNSAMLLIFSRCAMSFIISTKIQLE